MLDTVDLKMCTQNCTINFCYFLPKPSECITFIMSFHNEQSYFTLLLSSARKNTMVLYANLRYLYIHLGCGSGYGDLSSLTSGCYTSGNDQTSTVQYNNWKETNRKHLCTWYVPEYVKMKTSPGVPNSAMQNVLRGLCIF